MDLKETLPYKKCLNCGTELEGQYCHKCGQHASTPTPKIKDFLLEYANNAFIWDEKFLHTIKYLIIKPGFLSKAFTNGKFVSYVHPLKLNMFLLFGFITLFLLFSDTTKLGNSVDEITMNEEIFPQLVLSSLEENEAYISKLQNDERDTIMLQVSEKVLKKYSHLIIPIDSITIVNSNKKNMRKMSVPSFMLKEKIVEGNNTDGYVFSVESEYASEELSLHFIGSIWREMLRLITQYFPLIILFTIPILAFVVSIINRKYALPKIHSFVFTLHYTAFLEILLFGIYILYLLLPQSKMMLDWFVGIISYIYLTIALKYFYEGISWTKSAIKSLMINLIYLLICSIAFIIIFIIAIFAFLLKDGSF